MLFHDGDHGEPLIDALARFGEGLPANVLPVRVNEVTQLGPEAIASVFAYGGAGAALLARSKPKHDIASAQQVVDTCAKIVAGARLRRRESCPIIQTDDPDDLRAQLVAAPLGVATPKPAGMVARGAKRGVLETMFRELHAAAPAPVPVIALDKGAPFGGVNVKVDGCTLCHACVAACPTGALADNPEIPMLRFSESMCVQCGLCQATCPEKVITLEPRIDFEAWSGGHKVVKEEEPFPCIACGKPFGTKSAIERVAAKLGEPPLDVLGRQREAHRRHPHVRGLPRRGRRQRGLRSARRPGPSAGDDDGRLLEGARDKRQGQPELAPTQTGP